MTAGDRLDREAPGALARFLHRAAGIRWLARGSKSFHVAILRLSRGIVMRSWFGAPVLVLETVGRRTGRRRRTPVTYCSIGDAWVVVAINAGSERTPAWWLNLRDEPQAAILIRGRRIPIVARELEGEERHRLWRLYAQHTPVLDQFRIFTNRVIPVVLLEPRSEQPHAG